MQIFSPAPLEVSAPPAPTFRQRPLFMGGSTPALDAKLPPLIGLEPTSLCLTPGEAATVRLRFTDAVWSSNLNLSVDVMEIDRRERSPGHLGGWKPRLKKRGDILIRFYPAARGVDLEFLDEAGRTIDAAFWANPGWDRRGDTTHRIVAALRNPQTGAAAFNDFALLYPSAEALANALAEAETVRRAWRERDDLAAPWFGWPAQSVVRIVHRGIVPRNGVGATVFGMAGLLHAHGIPVAIYARYTHADLRHLVCPMAQLFRDVRPSDLVIYQYSARDEVVEAILALKCRKIAYFHNLTPPRFFQAYRASYARDFAAAQAQLPLLARLDGLLCNSGKTLTELKAALQQLQAKVQPAPPAEKAGPAPKETAVAPASPPTPSPAPVAVLPKRVASCPPTFGIRLWEFVPAAEFSLPPQKTKLLYVGRFVPHKKIEDLISLYHEFHRLDNDSCLLLAGGTADPPGYGEFVLHHLERCPEEVRRQVHFLTDVSEGQLKTIYQKSTAFAIMTEHEGFCIPLVEAMAFDLPIFAYAEPAVRETLGQSGRVYHRKDFPTIAADMHRLLGDQAQVGAMVAGQRRRREELARLADGTPLWTMMEGVMFEPAHPV